MAVISIFSATYTKADEVVEKLAEKTGFQVITDQILLEKTSQTGNLTIKKLERAVYEKPSVFDNFTRKRERSVAWLRSVIAEQLITCDKCIFYGFLSHLIPKEITHVLKCLIVADNDYRKLIATDYEKILEDAAVKKITKDDEAAFRWTELLHNKTAWDPNLYDIAIPIDKTGIDQTIDLIIENLDKPAVQRTKISHWAAEDYSMKSDVEKTLICAGHEIDVAIDQGDVILTINKEVEVLSKLEDELKDLVSTCPGVDSIKVRGGGKFIQGDSYQRHDFDMPTRVLLVDDEPEFVQVLSERLQAREVGSHVVFDGEQAMAVMDEDEPEVMVVDLKMPGIDGFEVLRKTKERTPHVEVIILTGQGSEEDQKRCMELGAFAFLRKPVDINVMTKTMKEAYAKVRENVKKAVEGDQGDEG